MYKLCIIYEKLFDGYIMSIFSDRNTDILTTMKMEKGNFYMDTEGQIYINTKPIHLWKEFINFFPLCSCT